VPIDIHSPDHWRRRATEMRALADETRLRSVRFLELAADYDRLAARAEERAEASRPRAPGPKAPTLRPRQLTALPSS